MDRERCAFRASGQAVCASLIGAPLAKASIEAGAILSDARYRGPCTRSDRWALAQIFILMMGVGAVQRYSFGMPPSDAISLLPHSDDAVSEHDLDHVTSISLRLDQPAFAAIEVIRQYASELIMQADIWDAVEIVANDLLRGPLSGDQVVSRCQKD